MKHSTIIRSIFAAVVVDGVGYGTAMCKKPAAGPWAVTVE